MATHDFTDDDRLNARVDAILASAFPLAASPDTPIGPLPLWKVRNLLVEAYQAGRASANAAPGTTGLADKLYSAPVHLDALSAAISLLAGCAQRL